MTQFIQLHLLVSYPPANLNRDDLGRPKTAKMGGAERLRVSSQSLKRAWRTSDVFESALAGSIGKRTKLLGDEAYRAFINAGIKKADAEAWAGKIASTYGAVKKDKPRENETLAHMSPEEIACHEKLIQTLIAEKREPTKEELDGLVHIQHAVDIAMFGRMLAHKPEFNTEAAIQVAHSIGVHASAIEDDYFTAVDDINQERLERRQQGEKAFEDEDGSSKDGDSGAGHVGEAGFAAAVFYQYLCINRDQLLKNLGGNEELLKRALTALVEAVLTVGPSGKQNSFASRAYVHYALAETGSQQPRSLSLAFLKPIDDKQTGYGEASIKALQTLRDNMDKVYGQCADASAELNVFAASGSKQAVLDLVAGA